MGTPNSGKSPCRRALKISQMCSRSRQLNNRIIRAPRDVVVVEFPQVIVTQVGLGGVGWGDDNVRNGEDK